MTPPGWPTGRYTAVIADPPWRYPHTQRLGGRGRRVNAAHGHYATLDSDQLAALPVGDLLAPGGHLWLWIPGTGLLDGWHRPLLDAWGVRPVTVLTWVKAGAPGLGTYARHTTEHVILAVNGWGGVPDRPLPATHFVAAKSSHSTKPACLADMAERLRPDGPWCELFARAQRLGWTSWGHGHETGVSA